MKEITLSRGETTQVDDSDHDSLSQFKWYLNRYGYAVRVDKRKCIFMHRVLMLPAGRQRVDHKDRNPLNNQRSNLRLCTASENLANRPKPMGSDGYKGVYWHKRAGKWASCITHQYRSIYLGVFVDPAQAARAYDKAAVQLFGDFAWLNFP